MMIHYVNFNKKRLVGRNNQPNVNPLVLDYSTVETINFQFIADNNQIVDISGLSGLYFAGSLSIGQMSYDLLFLSKDYTIENNILSFVLDTYTVNWLNKIRKKNTIINIEIGQVALEEKRVMMRETALACPRVYVAGLSPQEIDSHEYWTIEETQQAIDEATSGAVTKTYVDEQDEALQSEINGLESSKQDIIDASHNLSYDLLSGTPTIPEKLSDLQNDEDFVNEQYVENAVSGKADKTELEDYQLKVTQEAKLSYDLLSGTPSIPEKTSDLINNSDFATSGYVQAQVSGKADTTALTAHTSNTEIHTSSAEKEVWNGKQDNINSESKLDYNLISGTPSIPTKTSDLTNDSEFATSAYVQQETSGKADKSELENYQKLITNDAKLSYDLLSGTPTIPLSTSQLANDNGYATSGYVQQETSGKMDTPSGGTAGQVLTKTENGEEWADSQGGGGDGKNVNIEDKEKTGTTYVVDFVNGKQIQKYDVAYAASGDVEISIASLEGLTDGTAPTVELQIPVMNEVSSIVLPAETQIIEMPDVLSGGSVSGDVATYKYHDIVFRAEKDCNDEWKTYANYAYAFNEVLTGPIPVPMPTSGMVFYMPMTSMSNFEAVDPNITVQNYSSSYPVEFTTQNGIACAYCYGTPNRSIKIDNVTNSFPFGGTPRTVSFWVKYANSDYTAARTFFAEGQDRSGSSTGDGKAYDILSDSDISNSGIIVVTMANTADVVTSGSLAASFIQDQNWHHLCFTSYNNQSSILQVEMYLDGVLAYQATGTTSMNTATYYSFSAIGGYSHLTGYCDKTINGYIAGFRFYNRVLTQDEITALASEFRPTV